LDLSNNIINYYQEIKFSI